MAGDDDLIMRLGRQAFQKKLAVLDKVVTHASASYLADLIICKISSTAQIREPIKGSAGKGRCLLIYIMVISFEDRDFSTTE